MCIRDSAWSYGLAGCIYAVFALYLATGWRTGLRSRALFIAVVLCAIWGMTGLAFALTGQRIILAGSLLADIFRFGGWFLFLLVLLKPESSGAAGILGWPARLRGLCVVAVSYTHLFWCFLKWPSCSVQTPS